MAMYKEIQIRMMALLESSMEPSWLGIDTSFGSLENFLDLFGSKWLSQKLSCIGR